MDDALDLRDERRARRLGIGLRLVLYPMALGLIVLAWQQYHGGSSQADTIHVVEWSGVTSQGQAIRARSADGVLTGFDTHVLERCSTGAVFTQRWYPGQHRFVQRGENLHGRQAESGLDDSGRPVVFDDEVWARIDDHPRGTIRTQTSWTADHVTVTCESGPVTFTLSRSPSAGSR
jgi:hypothetical protein